MKQHGRSLVAHRARSATLEEVTQTPSAHSSSGVEVGDLKEMKDHKTMNLKSLDHNELTVLTVEPKTFAIAHATKGPIELTYIGPRSVLDELTSYGITGTLQTMIAPFSARAPSRPI